ncbi:MAG: preprotein translocase subunit SecG, partial [Thermodesulfobacteriota bacterium]
AVLFQVGKGATIGSTFGGTSSQTVFGASGGATFLSKITTACAVIFMVTSLFLTYSASRKGEESIMEDLPEVATPAAEPVAPALPEPVINVEVPPAEEAAAPAKDEKK